MGANGGRSKVEESHRDFRLSRSEMGTILRLWLCLQLSFYSAGDKSGIRERIEYDGVSDSLLVSDGRTKSKKTLIKRKLWLDHDHYKEFELRLCCNLFLFITLRDSLEITTEIVRLDEIRERYQVIALVKLITYAIHELGALEMDDSVLIRVSKINSRIWNLESEQYRLIGEALVLTLRDMLGSNVFTPNHEALWIKFYLKLVGVLVIHGQDAPNPEQNTGEKSLEEVSSTKESIGSEAGSETGSETSSQLTSVNVDYDDIFSVRTPASTRDSVYKPSSSKDKESGDDDLDHFSIFDPLNHEEYNAVEANGVFDVNKSTEQVTLTTSTSRDAKVQIAAKSGAFDDDDNDDDDAFALLNSFHVSDDYKSKKSTKILRMPTMKHFASAHKKLSKGNSKNASGHKKRNSLMSSNIKSSGSNETLDSITTLKTKESRALVEKKEVR